MGWRDKFIEEEKELWKQKDSEYKSLDEKWKKKFDDFSLKFRKAKADRGLYKF